MRHRYSFRQKSLPWAIGGSYAGAHCWSLRSAFHRSVGSAGDVSLEGAKSSVPTRRTATDFVLLVMNPKGAEFHPEQKVKLGGDAFSGGGSQRAAPARSSRPIS